MIDLSSPQIRAQFTAKLKLDIDAACVEHFKNEHREHLGASIIGHDCAAYVWNTFRHLKQSTFDGRMLRLFNRGHLEEHRFIQWLKLVGFEVFEIDPKTNTQYRISGVNGHFGGSLDCGLWHPEIGNLLGEFKTHNAKSFKKLIEEGVRKAKPQHYKQMVIYGHAHGLKYGLYCAVNKDTDELHLELVELDWNLAEDLYRKAEHIIYSQHQPAKIAQSETYFECRYCNFVGICHRGEKPEVNCRSCAHSKPGPEGTWICEAYKATIPQETIKVGCQSWRRII